MCNLRLHAAQGMAGQWEETNIIPSQTLENHQRNAQAADWMDEPRANHTARREKGGRHTIEVSILRQSQFLTFSHGRTPSGVASRPINAINCPMSEI